LYFALICSISMVAVLGFAVDLVVKTGTWKKGTGSNLFLSPSISR
jgi:hypothetical protein